MSQGPPESTRTTHAFPTRRSSVLLGHAGRERPAADEGGFAPRREDRRDEIRRRAAFDHAVAARPRLAGKQPPTLPGARGQSRSLGPENVHLAPDKKIGRAHV